MEKRIPEGIRSVLLITILTLFAPATFAGPVHFVEAGGGFCFPKYMTLPIGAIAYNRITPKGIFDLTAEFGYRQVPRNAVWLETGRLSGISGAFLYKLAPVFFAGPCIGIVSTEHYTYNPDYNLTPNEIENLTATNLVGLKVAVIVGEGTRFRLKFKGRLMGGMATETILDESDAIFGYEYRDEVRVSVMADIGVGIMVGW